MAAIGKLVETIMYETHGSSREITEKCRSNIEQVLKLFVCTKQGIVVIDDKYNLQNGFTNNYI